MDICGLCGFEKNLRESHIIPKFVFDWIKGTSATGYLRQAIKINKRIQDGPKEKLLCDDCELKFSKLENYFAREIFYPYVNKTRDSFEYDERLQKFILSLSWRMLKEDLKNFNKHHSEWTEKLTKTEEKWRKLLLEEECDDEYEHHILLLDYVEDSTEDLPEHFESYIMRSVDGTIVFSSKRVFLFSKFPAMVFVSLIYPKSINQDLEGTLIKKRGTIKIPWTCNDPEIGRLLLNRSKIGDKQPISDKQKEKIKDTMLKDLERVKKSKSYETWLEERKRKKQL